MILGLIILTLVIYIVYTYRIHEKFGESKMTKNMEVEMSREHFGERKMTKNMEVEMSRDKKESYESRAQRENFEAFEGYEGDGMGGIYGENGDYTEYLIDTVEPGLQRKHKDNFLKAMENNNPGTTSAVTAGARYITTETPPPPGPIVGFYTPRAIAVDYDQKQIPEIREESYAQSDSFTFGSGVNRRW